MDFTNIWISIYAVCRQAGDSHSAAMTNANEAVAKCKATLS